MALVEINFDGIVGPSHNYAGLSLGNLASTTNALNISHPRAAALQGVEKMRHNLRLGLAQGLFVPLPRPNHEWLSDLGTTVQDVPETLFWQLLQLIDLHEQEEEETEKQKQDDKAAS